MRILYTIVLFFFGLRLFSQIAPYMPADYIQQQKISKIIVYKLNSTDSMPYSEEYYDNGFLRQRTRFVNKNGYKEKDLDPNYKGNYLIYYDRFTYDNENRTRLSVGTWTGFKDPYIMIEEYQYSKGGDTIYSTLYNDESGHKYQSKRYQQCINDTIDLGNEKLAFMANEKDTLWFKSVFHKMNTDSIVYKHDSTYIKYLVYNGKLLVASGDIIKNIENSKEFLIRHCRTVFDNEGLPYASTEYNYSNNITEQEVIKCERYK